MRVRLCDERMSVESWRLMKGVWDRKQFSPGVLVREFEKAWALKHKARESIFVNSGTDALRLGLIALKEKLKWKDGDYVAVPATTFVASINVIFQAGLKPFLVDVGMYDFLMNPWNLEWRLQRKAKDVNVVAVMPVHLFGQSCPEAVYNIAKSGGMAVIEDSCETICNPTKGAVSCHSTYMAHHITTGVGGFASTNDKELALIIRSLANHGRNTEYLPGYKQGTDITKRFQFDRIGYSSRGTEMEAALGLPQLPKIEENVHKRINVFKRLKRRIGKIYDLVTLREENNTCMMFPIVIKENTKLSKWDFCRFLEKNGIETRDLMPVVNQPCYKGLDQGFFKVSEWLKDKGFYVPCHPGMSKKDTDHISDCVEKFAISAN